MIIHRSHILDAIVALLILLFTYAAVSKLLDLKGFRISMYGSPFPRAALPFIAWFIPLLELAIVATLFTRKWRLEALAASAILLFAFTAYIAGMMLFSPELPCSCGGIINRLGWTGHLFFNISFMMLALLGYFLQRYQNWIMNAGYKT